MFKTIRAIALNTFRETIRDRVLYSLIGFGVLVIAASLLAASVSLGQEARVIQSFGLTAMLVFLLFITIFIGTQLVFREVERKTIYLALTKPVSRDAFYLGKFFGLCLTIAVAALVMGVVFAGLVYWRTGQINPAVALVIVFMMFEGWLLTALGMLFSAFTAPLASAVYTFCLALIGHSTHTLYQISQKAQPTVKGLIQAVYYTFPNLEKFNLRNEIVFNLVPDTTQVLTITVYFLGYTVALLLLGMAAFRHHEF